MVLFRPPRSAISILPRLHFSVRPIFRRSNSTAPNESVWKLQNVDAAYWNDYIATRPKYDATIFDPIFKYHESENQNYNRVLDVGTGAGSALSQLLLRFQHVVASDNDTVSLDFAKQRYRNITADKLSWTVSKAEDLGTHHESSSFDMITCALTFPLLDTQKTLDTMHALLRPQGTLAIWFYGPPIFADAGMAEKAQEALYAALDHAFRPVVTGGGAQARADWKRAADGMASWLDYIPFSSARWNGVQRRKWNDATGARLAFFGKAACDFEIEPTSAVEEREGVVSEQDGGFWKVEWDIDMLKKFVLAIFPKPGHLESADETMEEHFARLERAVGGKGVRVPLTWPAVLVLARKNA